MECFFLFCFYRISINISRNLQFCATSVLLNIFHTISFCAVTQTIFLKCKLRCHSLNHHMVNPRGCQAHTYCREGPCLLCWPLLPLLCGFTDHVQLIAVPPLLCATSLRPVPCAILFPLKSPSVPLSSSTKTILTCWKTWPRHSISCGACLENLP